MSVYGDENLLLKLQSALLQAGNAREDPRGHAFFWTADDLSSSRGGNAACNRNKEREKTIGGKSVKLKRLLYLILGCICLGLGCVGIVLPILPTVPFFLVTVFCFAKSSQKLHDWFVSTKMYKKHLESFVKKKGMTVRTKATIMTSVTLLMGFGFTMMMLKAIYIPCIILAVVWIFHIIYFVFGVKTIKSEAE